MSAGLKAARRRLYKGCLVVLLALAPGLWVVVAAQPATVRPVLWVALGGFLGFSALLLGALCAFGDLFHADGTLDATGVKAVFASLLCVVQLLLAFISFFYQYNDMQNDLLEKAGRLYTKATVLLDTGQERAVEELGLGQEFAALELLDAEQAEKAGPLEYYRFPYKDGVVVLCVSPAYRLGMLRGILVPLATMLAASLILTGELVGLLAKRMAGKEGERSAGGPLVGNLRPLAFLFYFASRLGASFLPLMGQELAGQYAGEDALAFYAGLPQSAEVLFTCVAIVSAGVLLHKTGWKLPFGGGALVVTLGTVASALAPGYPLFLLGRAIVGLGYGFCWMTLRGFVLFVKNEAMKAMAFAALNAGLFAGMNCGSVFGSLLVGLVGRQGVLLLSAVGTACAALPLLWLPGQRAEKPGKPHMPEKTGTAIEKRRMGPLSLAGFVTLMVLPTSLLAAFTGYYLPLYFSSLGLTSAETGGAQLLYGLAIVYGGPMVAVLAKRAGQGLVGNLGYNLLLGLTLAGFGLVGGAPAALVACGVFGLADSYGFGAQNGYFMEFTPIKRLGAAGGLTAASMVKKLLEMLGPMAFALVLGAGCRGVAVLGMLAILCAAAYGLVARKGETHEKARGSG